MTLQADIAEYLETHAYGVYANATPALNSIFLDEFQDTPDNQIVIFGSGGQADFYLNQAVLEKPYFDIQVRNKSKGLARQYAEEIRLLLFDSVGVPTVRITNVPPYYPQYLGKDSSNRYRFMIPFQCEFWQ